jgi:hypothetical protein
VLSGHELRFGDEAVLTLQSGLVTQAPRQRPFQTVARRPGASFADPRREIDVMSVHEFAY